MMTKRMVVAAAFVAALAGGSAFAVAQPQAEPGIRRAPDPGPRGGGARNLGLHGIQLTDSQRQQVRSIMESHRAEFQAVAAKVLDARRDFAEAIEADTLDEAAIRARSTAMAAAMAEEAILQARVRSEVRALLSAEQLEQLKQRRAEFDKRRQERSERLQQRRREQ
jgi:periplasmic protein CpxP/Spy